MKEAEELNLEIRPVTFNDFDALTDISRICFPEQLWWRITKSNSRKWWRNLINSQNCEIWICSLSGQVIGFISLAFNRIKYINVWNEKHFTFLDCLHIFMSSPKQFIIKLFLKIKRYKAIKTKNTELSESENNLNTCDKIRRIDSVSNPWCGPISVLPGMQGMGVSKKLMEKCFQRAKSLGYKEVYGAVEKKNIMSRILSAIAGFKFTEEVDDLLYYKKSLENSHDTRVDSTR